jgi:hypothetical protein
MVEIVDRDEVAVHRDVAATVDAILRGYPPRAETRRRDENGEVTVVSAEEQRRDPGPQHRAGGSLPANRRGIVDISTRQASVRPPDRPERGDRLEGDALEATTPTSPSPASEMELAPPLPRGRGTESKPLRFYPFGVSRNRLEAAIAQLGVPAVIVRDLREADMVITLKNYYRRKPQPLREAEGRGTPVYVLRSNTEMQMEQVLAGLFPNAQRRPGAAVDEPRPEGSRPVQPGSSGRGPADDPVYRALEEAEEAIGAVIEGAPPVALAPQAAYIRRLQHQLADRFNLASRSRGREPLRHVEIYRSGWD